LNNEKVNNPLYKKIKISLSVDANFKEIKEKWVSPKLKVNQL
jgi:hypothetical protein